MNLLTPLPAHVGLLNDVDNERLEQLFKLPPDSAHCATCDGTGTFRFYDDMRKPELEREVVDYICPCFEQFVLQRYLLNAGIGTAFAQLFWGDATGVDAKTVQVVLDYAKKIDNYLAHGLGLFLHGEHGNGKSLVSSLLLKKLLSEGYDGYWITLDEMLSRYQETWRGGKDERSWFDRRMRNVRVLVVDDMGREFEGRTTAASSVDTIFRTRVQNGLTTIITTNLTQEKFIARYTNGIESLVTEACIHHEVIGGDWREALRERKRREVELDIRRPFTFGRV